MFQKKKYYNLTYIISVILLLCSSCANSQNFNGNYKSFFTSYSDEKDIENNYTENAEFNIYISDDFIAVQDIRISQDILLYDITEGIEKIGDLYVYNNCINEKLYYSIILYYKNQQLNMMISDSLHSQVFKNLKSTHE